MTKQRSQFHKLNIIWKLWVPLPCLQGAAILLDVQLIFMIGNKKFFIKKNNLEISIKFNSALILSFWWYYDFFLLSYYWWNYFSNTFSEPPLYTVLGNKLKQKEQHWHFELFVLSQWILEARKQERSLHVNREKQLQEMRIRRKSGKSFPDLKIKPKLYPGFERSDESFSSCNERHWRICFMRIYVYIYIFVPSHLFTYSPHFVCLFLFCFKYTNFQSSPHLAVLRIRKKMEIKYFTTTVFINTKTEWTGQFISKHFTLVR